MHQPNRHTQLLFPFIYCLPDDIKEQIQPKYYNGKLRRICHTKENGKVIFYMKESVDEQKAIQFLINPYLTSRRTNDFEIKKLPKSINYIQFNGVKYDLE